MPLPEGGTLLVYRAGSRLSRALPERAVAGLGDVLAPAVAGALPARRRMIARHLQRVHGRPVRPQEVRRAFSSYCRYWLESFRLPGLGPAELAAGMTCPGITHVHEARARGNGAILALPHLGGWDFGGAWLASTGLPLTVVVEPLEPPEVFEWFADFRRSLGMTVVPLGPAAGGAVLRALKANEVVALLSDRDLAGGGVPVDFFGERTTLPGGPVTLALRTGAALLPTAVYFDGPGHHHGDIRAPLPLERSGRLRDDVAAGTERLAAALEELIRVDAEQWHLMQPNWPSDRSAASPP